MDRPFDSPEYRRSRNAYTLECAFEYFVTILMTDAFLAKLLGHIGLSDAEIGIIASFVSFSFLFQLFSILLMQKIGDVKRTVILCHTLSELLFLSVYLVPFLPVGDRTKGLAAAAGMLGGYALQYLVSSVLFRWANGFVDPRERATFSAVKEMISLLSGIVFTLAMGFVFDSFEENGNLRAGFLVLAGVILFLNICNFVCFCLIRWEEVKKTERKPLGEVLRAVFTNRDFLHIMILTCIWEAARYLSVGFLGTYKTAELAFSVGAVQVINTAANLCRFAVSRPFGVYSDRTSYAHGFRLAMLLAAAGFAVGCFVSPGTRWLIVVYTLLYNVSCAGSNQNSFNMVYSYVEPDIMVQAMAIRSSVGGLVGFGASLVGSRILSAVQERGNSLFGVTVYGQQILLALSCLLTLCAMFYTGRVVERQRAVKR